MASQAKQRQAEIALHGAIQNGRVDEVRRLLADGVDPNAFDDKSNNFKYALTALCTVISVAATVVTPTHKQLIEAINEMQPDKPRHDAELERANAMEILRLLLAAGADPSRPTWSRTPLSLAVCNGDEEIVRILLDSGADPAGPCWSPLSELPRPKGALAFYANAIHEAASGYIAILRLLCDRGAEIEVRNHEGRTPLHIAVGYGQTEIVRYLCSRGADTTSRDAEGRTAFQIASRRGYLEIAEILRRCQETPVK